MRSAVTALIVLLSAATVHAQNELDALRFNGSTVMGTARSVGMGGAFSAVGADFSAATLNPAGLALYRRSDLSLTPTLRISNNSASFLDATNDDFRSRLGFSNVGYVHAQKLDRWNRETRQREEATTGLKSYAFSIGFNQLDNYNRNTTVTAYNPINSITDYYASLARGRSFDDVWNESGFAGQALNAGLIDTSGVDGNYVGAALGGDVEQRLTMLESGRRNEWTIGFAGNFSDLVYFGGSIGIQDLRYSNETLFLEEDINDVHNTWANDSTPLNTATFNDAYTTRGSGVNFRVGVIVRPADFIRFGVSVTTPTWMSLTDNYLTDINAQFDNDPDTYGLAAQNGLFTYNMTTPFKATTGVMVLIKKYGFLSADFEYTDYTTSKFSSDVGPASPGYYDFQTENAAIRQLFDAAYNMRLGGEFRLGPGRFRLGYSNFGSILKDENLEYLDYESGAVARIRGDRQTFTGGVGLKQRNYYLDFAYARQVSADRRLFYTVQDPNEYSPELINRITTNIFLMTIGFTF